MKAELKTISITVLLALSTALMNELKAEPTWPDALDFDFGYRDSAMAGNVRRWDLRLGLGVEIEPTFQGSDERETELDAIVIAGYQADWGNLFFTGGGLGYSRMLTPDFGIQLQLEAEDTREESDDDRLRGLGDQDEELELEIVGRYFLGPWQLGGSVALATGDKGVVWFVGGGRSWRLSERGFLNWNVDVSGSNRDNQQTDFGITEAQSNASVSGFPVYRPGGGLKSFGVNVSFDYRLTNRWFLNAELDYERLLGDVADSPLVSIGGSENNIEAGLGIYYRF